MPVLFDSSASSTKLIAGASTSGNDSFTHNVGTLTKDTVVAFLAVVWTGDVDTSTASFSATFGGEAMTLIETQTWDSNTGVILLFKLEDAPRGAQTVVASYNAMGTELVTRNLMCASATYSGVDEVGATVDEGGSEGTTNTVAVSSTAAAHRVFSAHGVGLLRSLTSSGYNQTKRERVVMFGGGSLLIGDAEGAETVTCTATHNASTDEWGAIGVAMSPAVVELTATLRIRTGLRASTAVYRTSSAHPDREYSVPAIGSADPLLLGGDYVVSSDGVAMPVWIKDVDDTLEYTLHWNNYLVADDEIVYVEHLPAGTLTVFSESFDGDTTQVWLSGGTATVTHPVRIRMVTKKGRQHDRTFYIAGGTL